MHVSFPHVPCVISARALCHFRTCLVSFPHVPCVISACADTRFAYRYTTGVASIHSFILIPGTPRKPERVRGYRIVVTMTKEGYQHGDTSGHGGHAGTSTLLVDFIDLRIGVIADEESRAGSGDRRGGGTPNWYEQAMEHRRQQRLGSSSSRFSSGSGSGSGSGSSSSGGSSGKNGLEGTGVGLKTGAAVLAKADTDTRRTAAATTTTTSAAVDTASAWLEWRLKRAKVQ